MKKSKGVTPIIHDITEYHRCLADKTIHTTIFSEHISTLIYDDDEGEIFEGMRVSTKIKEGLVIIQNELYDEAMAIQHIRLFSVRFRNRIAKSEFYNRNGPWYSILMDMT